MEKAYKWLNSHSRLFLERGYLEEGITPEKRIRDIAENAERILGIEGYADKFEKYVSLGYYSLSTPVWINYGNKRGLPVSCFNSHMEDTMTGILWKVGEVGIMSKMGGGTSGYFGDLRKRGSKISSGGESSGAVHFMELFDKVSDVVSQGSARRGSFAAYLPVEHPDIEEFLMIRSEGHSIQNMSLGVTVSDNWMNEMIGGDKDKRGIWAKIIKKRFETGYPYIFFTDTVNNNAPQVYKDKGYKINSSNLCVTGDTEIEIQYTDKEFADSCFIDIKDLKYYIDNFEDIKVKSYDIKDKKIVFSKIKDFAQTGVSTELIEIENELGNILKCTPDHKIFTNNRGYVLAEDLNNDDILESDLFMKTSILRISKIKSSEPVYDITVENTENFYANNILVHNCSEITLQSNSEESFVCVLSSLNLLHWDEIKETDAIETLIYFLDTVNQEFVEKTQGMKFMEAPHEFAKNQRALGMGVLGWHSLLQSEMIAFESLEAKMLNSYIWKIIRDRADQASKELADLFGEPELLKGYGRRNVTTIAVAPTTSSSFILGQVSPSIEPLNSNYFVKKLAKGSFTFKNPYLKEVLKNYKNDTDEVWKSILIRGGSVQHLDFLTSDEKSVFKTFGEISQKEIIIQAAQRQNYIDQSQSLNIMIPPDIKPKEVSDLLIEAWKMGIKTLYYQRSANPAQELSRNIMTCASCES